MAGIYSGIVGVGESSGLAMGNARYGVARATRGVPVPVCNGDSNFILLELPIQV